MLLFVSYFTVSVFFLVYKWLQSSLIVTNKPVLHFNYSTSFHLRSSSFYVLGLIIFTAYWDTLKRSHLNDTVPLLPSSSIRTTLCSFISLIQSDSPPISILRLHEKLAPLHETWYCFWSWAFQFISLSLLTALKGTAGTTHVQEVL